jgi:predicted PurR-regulated permease PerM
LLILAVALWWLGRRAERGAPVPGWLNVLVTVLSVVVAIAATVQMVLVGHSGAEAVWGS